MSRLFLILLWFSSTTLAETPVSTWTLSVFGTDITNNLFESFYRELGQKTGLQFDRIYGAPHTAPIDECRQRRYDLVISAIDPKDKRRLEACGYRLIAVAELYHSLYATRGMSMNKAKRIGMLKTTRIGPHALQELKKDNANFNIQYKLNESQLLLALFNNQLDAVVMSTVPMISLTDKMRSRIVKLKQFDMVSLAVIYSSDVFLASESGTQLAKVLLSNPSQSQKLFVDTMQLSPWLNPDHILLR